MNPLIGRVLFMVAVIISILIRIPHDKVSQRIKTIEDRKDWLEKLLLFLVLVGGGVLPLLSFTPALAFADEALSPLSLLLGTVFMGSSLWLFYRSHADLGANWSSSLEIRESHRLVMSLHFWRVRRLSEFAIVKPF